jgi:hypothetical protein
VASSPDREWPHHVTVDNFRLPKGPLDGALEGGESSLVSLAHARIRESPLSSAGSR